MRYLFMDDLPHLFEKAVVYHFLCEGMLEDVFQVGIEGAGSDEIEPFQPLERTVYLLLEFGDPLQDLIEKGPANDRGLLKDAFSFFLQTVKPCRNDSLDGRGDIGICKGSGENPGLVFSMSVSVSMRELMTSSR